MKINVHLYTNLFYGITHAEEVEIENSKITVKELKQIISYKFQIEPSEQILTMKFWDKRFITLSDNFPLSFFFIKDNSDIYLEHYINFIDFEDKNFMKLNKKNREKTKSIKSIQRAKYLKRIYSFNGNKQKAPEEKSNIEYKIEFLGLSNKKYKVTAKFLIKETNPDIVIKKALNYIKNNKLVELKILLQNHYDIIGKLSNIINKKNGWNALHCACFYGREEILKYLLELNINNNVFLDLMNELTNDKNSPLHFACFKGYSNVVKTLLLYIDYLNINIINIKRNTPLHIACEKNFVKIVSMLIASKANLFIKNIEGKNPIDLTTDSNIKKLIIKSMIYSPNFKFEEQQNINSELALYIQHYFTPPKPPKTIGFLEKRGHFLPYYKYILFEINPLLGYIKIFSELKEYPLNYIEIISLKNIRLCKIEKTKSKKKYYFSLTTRKTTEIFRVYNKNALNEWIKIINESIIYYKYWAEFQKKNKRILEYIMNQKKVFQTISYRTGLISVSEDKNSYRIKNSKTIKKDYKDLVDTNLKGNDENKYYTNYIESEESFCILKHNSERTITNEKNIKSTKSQNINPIQAVKFESFVILDLLGTGTYGKVFKTKLKNDSNEKIYAMKIINKNFLIRYRQLKYAVSECNVLKQCESPFIIKLYYSFQTLENLYMIEDYCPGGDIQSHLKISIFDETEAKFYIAEIILAIEYLHNKNIIYRDLKPENILIGEDNHIKLADFGLAKEGIVENDVTKSFCGSPAYLPPEMLLTKGVGKSADIYGIGTVLYEMVCGTPPFFSNHIKTLFHNIRHNKLILHDYFSNNLKDLLMKLLNKNPEKRIGIHDKNEIKKHPFFKGLNWDKLKRKELTPPIDFMQQKIDVDNYFFKKKNKKVEKKNFYFKDLDYTSENKFVKRVRGFTFIRKKNNEV